MGTILPSSSRTASLSEQLVFRLGRRRHSPRRRPTEGL